MPNFARMSGGRQDAGKVGHSAFVDNPEVRAFLSSCNYMQAPDGSHVDALRARFLSAPTSDEALPSLVIAIDGSAYESAFHQGLPSTRVGYVKVSGVAVNLRKYQQAADGTKRTIDPFALAGVFDGRASLTLCLPSSNMEYGNSTSVRHGFRRRMFEEFASPERRIPGRNETLLDTLFRIAELTSPTSNGEGVSSPKGGKLPSGERFIRVVRCAACDAKPHGGFLVPQKPGFIQCSQVNDGTACDAVIYATDVLRVHETVTSQSGNLEAISRTMNVVEAVFLAHYVLYLSDVLPDVLANTCFVVDGPLALFGEAAWMHGHLLRLFHSVQAVLTARGLRPFLLFGLQKSGQVADHANMIGPHLLEEGTASQAELLLAVSDDYRSEFIRQREDDGGNFGDEVYWGQDFLFRSDNGDVFVVGIPYPFSGKRVPDPAGMISAEANFRALKADCSRYATLGRTLDVIRAMRSDLYQSSIVPVLAAHQEASISLVPGGSVLDLLAHLNFGQSGSK